jgi:hypothetical protein
MRATSTVNVGFGGGSSVSTPIVYGEAEDRSIFLPDGIEIPGRAPVVIVGPNGSGKTRKARNIGAEPAPTFVNALRNTRVAPEIPAMGLDSARANFKSQVDQSRNNHWEMTSEFDHMLSRLIAEHSMVTNAYFDRAREDMSTLEPPAETPFTRVQNVWGQFFPGRRISWEDWKPTIRSAVGESELTYSGNQMSDGEKAALFLASRVFSSDAGVLVVDEPETHFHSLLAVQLWDALEAARPDIRFVYITHDLVFALSRKGARYVLAEPAGLRTIEIDGSLPADVAQALLGAASLSFYASRVVFCEGKGKSYDSRVYNAWFNGVDTVVREVGGCQEVLRCVSALDRSGIATGLDVAGIIDGDYHSDRFLSSLTAGVHVLKVHEIESLFSLPGVVGAVCDFLNKPFDEAAYLDALRGTVSPPQRAQVATQRWKERVEPQLVGLVASVGSATDGVVLASTFDQTNWKFSPSGILNEEVDRVNAALDGKDVAELFKILPAKQLTSAAARFAGIALMDYVALLLSALNAPDESPQSDLGAAIQTAWSAYLPARTQPVKARTAS